MNFKWCTYQGKCWDKPAHIHTEEDWKKSKDKRKNACKEWDELNDHANCHDCTFAPAELEG